MREKCVKGMRIKDILYTINSLHQTSPMLFICGTSIDNIIQIKQEFIICEAHQFSGEVPDLDVRHPCSNSNYIRCELFNISKPQFFYM